MIPLIEINAKAKKFNVSAETIEKDYIISWLLYCISQSEIKNNFVFYGGTAIKKIYYENHRFSEDIDLICEKKISAEFILKELKCLSLALTKANISLKLDNNNILRDQHRLQVFIKYEGFDEIVFTPKTIRLDFCMDMKNLWETHMISPITVYSDVPTQNSSLNVMTLNTILANKLGLLIDRTRNEPRDLYDIWVLLQKAKQFKIDFEKVSILFKKKYNVFPTFSLLASYLAPSIFKAKWQNRLKHQINNLPDLNLVINETTNYLNKFLQIPNC